MAGHSTPGPTAMSSPAASTPRARGGTRPTSQPPVRTISSQFPTPAALTSISIWPASSGGGSGSSRTVTSPPYASMPAALKLTRESFRDPAATAADVTAANEYGSMFSDGSRAEPSAALRNRPNPGPAIERPHGLSMVRVETLEQLCQLMVLG